MNADFYYEQGKQHVFCEDFATAGHLEGNDISYAIISDGCSGSSKKNSPVDFGARILSFSFIDSLEIFYQELGKHSVDVLSHYIIGKGLNTLSGISGLGVSTLDATIVAAFSDGKKNHHVMAFGDGCFAVKYLNDILVYSIEYESGAPYYLRYLIDTNGREMYEQEFGNSKKIIKSSTYSLEDGKWELGFEEKHDELYSTYTHLKFDQTVNNSEIEWISVMSDGIHTYGQGRNSLSFDDIAYEFLNYKNFKGEFVKRRMLSFKKRCDRDDIVHYDDISVATICLGD